MRWDPDLYAVFEAYRSRPFHDLVGRVRRPHVATAIDLGCGTGELTATLLERWPDARVIGVDSSPEMLARANPIEGRLRFEQGDIATWRPEAAADLVISNAALQWVPDHDALVPHLVSMVAPGGTLAVQMPYNFDAGSHRAIAEVVCSGRFDVTPRPPRPVKPLDWYADALRDHGMSVDAWETTYLQHLPSLDAIVSWVSGTALRPYLGELPAHDRDAFVADVRLALTAYYPRSRHGVHFPFRRVFVVASRDTIKQRVSGV